LSIARFIAAAFIASGSKVSRKSKACKRTLSAATIETQGQYYIGRRRPNDQRDRYLSEDELRSLKRALDEKIYRKGTKDFNKTFCRLRLIVLIAVTTGMRAAEIFGLTWSDAMYNEGLLAVRAMLKGGKMRYVPMPPELADEWRRSLRTGKDPGPLEYKDDGTLCQAGAATHCQDQQNGAEMWKLFERAATKVNVRQPMYAYCSRDEIFRRF